MRVRTESHERRVYGLILANRDRRLGPGLVPSSGSCSDAGRRTDGRQECQVIVGSTLRAADVTMSEFAEILSGYEKLENRLVIDRTGLLGRYDVTMTEFFPWLHRPPGGALPPPNQPERVFKKTILLPSALKDMLGLKLDSMKAPVDVLVVDQAERPVVY